MRLEQDVGMEDLGSLGNPEQRAVGRAHDRGALDDLERVDGGVAAHDAVGIERALEHVDGMHDGLGENEGARTVVHSDDGEILGDGLDAVQGRFLADAARRDELNGRHQAIRLDGEAAVLLAAGLGTHDDDLTHAGHGVECLQAPRHKGLAADGQQLLAAVATETLAGSTGDDDGGNVGFFTDDPTPRGARDVGRR